MSRSTPPLTLAANNGDMGGGEVMLLAAATAARNLGVEVEIVGPAADGGVIDAAHDQGFSATALSPRRASYLRELRAWDARTRKGMLWCHGLVPALATAGHPRRIVHLHRAPSSRGQRLAVTLASLRAARVLVPSDFIARQLPGSSVLWNWTAAQSPAPDRAPSASWVVGFIGRPSIDKGVDVLAEALAMIEEGHPGQVRLVIAGEPRFVDAEQQRVVANALGRLAGAVTYLGWVDPADFFAQCDLVVVPSLNPEAFGLVAAEAMAACRPLVISDAGALPEVVGADHPWVTVAGEASALAGAIEAIINSPAAQRDRVIAAARERWQAHFSPEAGTARVADLLGSLGLLP